MTEEARSSAKPEEAEATQESNGAPGLASEETESLIGQLREQRKKIGSKKHVDLPVPGYEMPELVVRYKRLDWDEVKKIAQTAEESRHPQAELMGQIDLIIRSTDQILIRHDGKVAPLSSAFPEIGEEPVGWDKRLLQALAPELEVKTARGVVRAIFSNDLAITDLHLDLWRWMKASNQEADEDF